jgi:hypothetical protein
MIPATVQPSSGYPFVKPRGVPKAPRTGRAASGPSSLLRRPPDHRYRPPGGRSDVAGGVGRTGQNDDSRSGVAEILWIDRSAPSNSASGSSRRPTRAFNAP